MTKPTIRSVLPAKTDQSVQPPCMATVLIYPSLDKLEAVEGTCDQRRPIKLRGCAGRSESSLGAQVLEVLSCADSLIV